MTVSSINVRCLALLGVVLLTPLLGHRPTVAGDFFRKKSQLIAVPVAQPVAASSVLYALPAQPAQVSVVQVPAQQALITVPAFGNVAKSVTQGQQQSPPGRGDPPSIQITVIEAEPARTTSTPQAAPSAQTSTQLQGVAQPRVQYVTVQSQSVTTVAPVISHSIAVPQATPVQLYYVPATPRRSWFKSH
ncbi:hypothetical protein [Tautonia rosea]|uniref:hypothetical protein n=1 Tax=Tautonia rosea TaxID=2728037 RepID=UPI001474FD88|nr:hypothetical protein [Tautonia rosea]